VPRGWRPSLGVVGGAGFVRTPINFGAADIEEVNPDPNFTPSPADADFWDNVVVGLPGECWPYRPGLDSVGPYGHVRIWFRGQRVYAHRVAFALAGGVLGDGEIVTHRCDDGGCSAPGCLRAGTVLSNNQERDERNRRTPFLPHGTAHWSAKLNEDTLEVVRRGRGRIDANLLALLVNVSATTVRNVWSQRTYLDNAAQQGTRAAAA
jgi:hypothetical protein